MKQTILAAAVAALALGMSGCAYLRSEPQPLQFNYTTKANADTGLVRAFDMKGNTVLQFVDLAAASPQVFDTDRDGPALPYQVVGQYAVLAGIHPALRVQTAGGSATVTRSSQEAAKAAPATAEAAEAARLVIDGNNAKTELQQALLELDKTKKELAELKRQLAAQQANPKTPAGDLQKTHAQIDGIEQRMADAAAVILRVNFGFASTDFAPANETKTQLLAGAKAAERINVRGRTDSPKADAANYRIALGRALAARKFLVSNGIDAKKIHLFAQAAGDFIAENRTTEGRRQNRRVEIELVGQEAVRLVAGLHPGATKTN